MKNALWLFLFLIAISGIAFGYVSTDRNAILYPYQSYSFWVYDEPDGVTVNLYYMGPALQDFLGEFKSDSLKKPLKQSDQALFFEEVKMWKRLEIPSGYFERTGTYLLEFVSKSEKDYTLLLKTNVNGALVSMGESVFLKLWDNTEGKDVRFTQIVTGYTSPIPLSIAPSTGIVEIEKSRIVEETLFIETPYGILFLSDSLRQEYAERDPLIFLTDRPLYRPGDLVQARAVLLDSQTGELLAQRSVEVVIEDPLGREKMRSVFQSDSWGGISFIYETFPDDTRGHYTVKIRFEKKESVRYFELADYAKPSFTVKAALQKPVFALDEPIDLRVEATYYYGQSVSDANLHLHVIELSEDYYDESEKILDSRVFPVKDGVATASLQIPRNKKQNVQVTCTVVDQTGREIEDTLFFRYIPSDVEIDFKLSKSWLPFGQTANGTVQVKSLLSQADIARAMILEIFYDDTLEASSTVYADPNGAFQLAYEPKKPGSYRFRLTDAKYPAYAVERYLFSYASTYTYRTGKELDVFTNLETAGPGDQIIFNVVSSFPSLSVLALIDDGNQASIREIKLKNGNGQIAFYVSDKVNASSLRCRFVSFYGSKWLTKYLSVPVDLSHRQATILIRAPEETRPGETIPLEVQLMNKEEKPVEGAVTLGILDQAVLDLYGDDDWEGLLNILTNPPLRYGFYYFNDSYYYYRLRNTQSSDYVYETAETLAQTKQAATNRSVKVRTKFSDTAFWTPLWVVSGSDKTEITLPEDLTTWSVRAMAFTKTGLTGYAKTQILSTLPVTVNPVFPKFLRSGDQTRVGLLVGNSLDQEETFTVSLGLPQEAQSEVLVQTAVIPARSSRVFWFTIALPEVERETSLAFSLKAEGVTASDAMVHEIPVKPNTMEIPTGLSGLLSLENQRIAYQAETETRLSLTISADISGDLLEALRYLIRYPYGCVEQTVSSFLPAIVARYLIQERPEIGDQEPFNAIEDIIRNGVQRLYGLQNYQGGWGWWAGGSSDPFMTAYVLYAFDQLKQSGYEVNEDVVAMGVQALKNVIKQAKEYEAFCYYVIKLFDSEYPLLLTATDNLETKLFLALSFVRMGEKSAADALLKEIIGQGTRAAPLFYVRFEKNAYFMSSFQKNALLLSLMHALAYEGAEKRGLILYLFKNRSGEYWTSTKDTSFAVMALAGDELLSDQYVWQAEGNLSDYIPEFTQYARTLLKGERLTIPICLRAGDSLEIDISGTQGLLWKLTGTETWKLEDYKTKTPETRFSRKLEKLYEVTSYTYQDKDQIDTYRFDIYLPWDVPILPGLIVQKGIPVDIDPILLTNYELVYAYTDRYQDDVYELFVNGHDTGLSFGENCRVLGFYPDHLVLNKNPWLGYDGHYSLYFVPNKTVLKVGDKVRHRFPINTTESLAYSVLEDSIPAAFIQAEGEYGYYEGKYFGYGSNWLWYTHKEDRYDRTAAFYSAMREGKANEKYYYTITTAGTFQVPPAVLYEMYDPSRVFVTNGYQIQVHE